MFFEKMQNRKNDGFTLVELIVVIAILAILAGIAVPAYSGYIEKANVAADEQLLHAINTAFAAATSGNGVVATNADLPIAADGTVDPATLSVTPASDKVLDDFKIFFAGNENSAFKVAEDLLYNGGVFKLVGKGIPLTLSYAGGNIILSYDDIEKFKDSAFATEIGAESLLGMVDAAADLIGSIEAENSQLVQLANSDGAYAYLCKALGIASKEEIGSVLISKYPQGNMSDDAYNTFLEQKTNELIANNAVLYAASTTNGSVSSYMEVLKATNVKDTIKKAPDDASMMSQSAMAYAMYSAYTGNTDMENLNLQDVYSTLDSTEFKSYLDTPQATADLEGYLASMNMVNSGVTSDSNAAVDVLLNGFTSPELEGLLNQLAGK